MKRAAAILLGIGLICGLIYLSWLNPTPVEFRLASGWVIQGYVGALMVAAFTAGASFILVFASIGAARRAIVGWRSDRRRRKNRRIDEWEERGEQLIWQGDVPRGRALLQKAFQRRPQDARPVLALAASYHDTGELHRARGVLYDAATQHHTDPEVLYALADVHRTTGETGPYLETLERLRALYPHAPRALRALRDAYEVAGRWQEAMTLQETLAGEVRDPEGVARERQRLLALRYQVALENGDPKTRLRALEALADGRAPALPLMVSVGDALVATGQVDEASILWERALRSNPRSVLVERLARIATETKHRERLRAVLRKLRADQVQADALHLVTAKSFVDDGDVEAAAKELEAVATTGRVATLWHRLWAQVHHKRGQLEQALASAFRIEDRDQHRCRSCGHASDEWVGYCPACHDWDSYRAAVEIGVR